MIKKCKVGFVAVLLAFCQTALAKSDMPDFRTLVKNNAKTVVQIDTVTEEKPVATQGYGGQEIPDLFRYFFEGPNGMMPQPRMQPQPKPRRGRASGSGFIIENDGYIMTNAHVVKDTETITVTMTDQKEYDAELIGLDVKSDIAVIKIDAKNLPTAKVGNSDDVEVGEWVLAIGSPFGFEYTATKGIISAVSRSLPDGQYVPFIQTDAAVNPGNSGGPLFNLDGEVIGVNTLIYSRSGGFNGLAFAVPMNTAMDVAEQLRENGSVSRGWLGIGLQQVTQDLADSFGLDSPTGALVSMVVEGSPAEAGGLQQGDIILAVNDETVISSGDLPPIIGRIRAGTKAKIKVLRNQKEKVLTVEIGELAQDGQVSQGKSSSSRNTTFGFDVVDIPENVAAKYDLGYGVMVKGVARNSLAAKQGFAAGDVILSINQRKVKDRKTFNALIKDLEKNKVHAFLVKRRDNTRFVPFEVR